MRELKTKDMTFLLEEDEADNIMKLLNEGAELIRLRDGTVFTRHAIRSITKSPEEDPSKLLGGKQTWETKLDNLEKVSSKSKYKVEYKNGVPQFVKKNIRASFAKAAENEKNLDHDLNSRIERDD